MTEIAEWLVAHKIALGEVLSIYAIAGVLHTTGKIAFAWLKARRMHKMLKDVPLAEYDNPEGFLGFFAGLRKNIKRDKDWFNEVTAGKSISKMIGMRFEPSQVWLIVRDPLCIRHFLKDSFEKYSKPRPTENPFFYYFQKWVGDGIFTFSHGVGSSDNGHSWLTQRKIAANIFSKANFQNNMGEVFVEKSLRLSELLEREATAGRDVDIQKMFFSFTMDSITRIFWGEDADTLDNATCHYADAYDAAHRALVTWVRPSMAMLLQMSYLPWPFGGYGGLAWKIYEWRSPLYQDFRQACKILDSESNRIVRASREDPKLSSRRDLLALFLQSEAKEKFSSAYMRDMLMNFVIAGRDTTACTLSWAFYVLCANTEVQRRLIEEIDAKLPDRVTPTLKQLSASSMPYLNGVIYEVLRLYPPVPSDSKTCFEDDVFPDGTKIPKGTVCFWQPYALGRDPAVYSEPEAVKPERWIPFTAPAPHDFPVFQAGPRICLGMDMAIFEAKLVVAMLLQRYTFDLKPGEAEKIHYSGTITLAVCNSKQQDSHNLWVKPTKRS